MKKANVIILAGQSNAVGVGFTKYLPKYFDDSMIARFKAGYENIQIAYMSHDIVSDGFVRTTINCTERSKDTLGPEVGIAKNLTERYPQERFFIIKCAFGGTNLYSDWRSPGSGVPYDENLVAEPAKAINDAALRFPGWCYNCFVKWVKGSLAKLEQLGYAPTIIGFCWMQGEADATAEKNAAAYIDRYDALLRDIRSTFAPYFEDCKFIDGGISKQYPFYERINREKANYDAAHGYQYLDTIGEGLTTHKEPEDAPDLPHYDCGSVVRLGEMFARKINL